MWWWSGVYNTFIISIITIILLQTKANARDSEESRYRWSHSCSLYQREVNCVERGEVAGEPRGSGGCTYPPASKALLQSSVSRCAVQSEGETPPSGSLQAKISFGRMIQPQWSGPPVRFMWRYCVHACRACVRSLQSHRDGCVIGCAQKSELHMKGTYCANTVTWRWEYPALCC